MGQQIAPIRAALERAQVTSRWPAAAVEEICAASELRAFRDGERIISVGEEVSALWIVTQGTFAVSRSWQNGRRLLHSYLKPGQATGVLPVFDGLPAVFDVVARGDGAALAVPGTVIRKLTQKYPHVALEIIGYLCQRARADYEAIELHAMNSVRCRIAKSILWIARGQTSTANRQAPADARISQEDLADIVCAARQSVNRELRRLMKEGIIKQRYRALVILDRERLEQVAAEDETLLPGASPGSNETSGYLHSATE